MALPPDQQQGGRPDRNQRDSLDEERRRLRGRLQGGSQQRVSATGSNPEPSRGSGIDQERARLRDRLEATRITTEGPPSPESEPWQSEGFLGDTAVGLARGAAFLPEVATGIGDIGAATLGFDRPFSRTASAVGEATGFQPSEFREDLADRYSPQTQAAQSAVEEAGNRATEQFDQGDYLRGVGTLVGGYLQNPRAIQSLVTEPLPAIVAGGLVGRGAVGLAGTRQVAGQLPRNTGAFSPAGSTAAPASATSRMVTQNRLSGTAGGAIGEGTVAAGATMSEIDEDVDPLRAAGTSVGAGVGTSLIAGGGAALARRAGLSDIETVFAGGDAPNALARASRPAQRNIATRVLGGAVSEGVLQELPQEALQQIGVNFAEGGNLLEGVPHAAVAGMLAGSAMGAGVNLPGGIRARAAEAPTDLTATDAATPATEEDSTPPDPERLFEHYQTARTVAEQSNNQKLKERATHIMQRIHQRLDEQGIPREAVEQEVASRKYQELRQRQQALRANYNENLATRPEKAEKILRNMGAIDQEMRNLERFYDQDQLFPQDARERETLTQRIQDLATSENLPTRVTRKDGSLTAPMQRLVDSQRSLEDSELSEAMRRIGEQSTNQNLRNQITLRAEAERRGFTVDEDGTLRAPAEQETPADPLTPTDLTDVPADLDPGRAGVPADLDPGRAGVQVAPRTQTEPVNRREASRVLNYDPRTGPQIERAVEASGEPVDAEIAPAETPAEAPGTDSIASRVAEFAAPTRVLRQDNGELRAKYQPQLDRFNRMTDANLRTQLRRPGLGGVARAIARAVAEQRGMDLTGVRGTAPLSRQTDMFGRPQQVDLAGDPVQPAADAGQATVDENAAIEATGELFDTQEALDLEQAPEAPRGLPAPQTVVTPDGVVATEGQLSQQAARDAEQARTLGTDEVRNAVQRRAARTGAPEDINWSRVAARVSELPSGNSAVLADGSRLRAHYQRQAEALAALPSDELIQRVDNARGGIVRSVARAVAEARGVLDVPGQTAPQVDTNAETETETETEAVPTEQAQEQAQEQEQGQERPARDPLDDLEAAQSDILGDDLYEDVAEQASTPEDVPLASDLNPEQRAESRSVYYAVRSQFGLLEGAAEDRLNALHDRMADADRRLIAGELTAEQYTQLMRESRADLAEITMQAGIDPAQFQRRAAQGSQAEPLPFDQTEQIVQELTADWAILPDTLVARNASQLPEDIREQIAQDGADSEVNAVYYDGRAYIVADRMHSRRAIEEALLHEIKGHFGLRVLLGSDLQPVLERVYNEYRDSPAADRARREIAEMYNLDETTEAGRMRLADELLAHIAQDNPKPSLLQQALAAINRGLRRLGFQTRVGRSELIMLMHRAGQVVEHGGVSYGPLAGGEVLFQRGMPQENAAHRERKERFMDRYNATLSRAPESVQAAIQGSRDWVRRALQTGMFSHDLVDFGAHLLPQNLRPYFETLRAQVSDRSDQLIQIQEIVDPVKNWSQARRTQLNDLLKDSTMSERWAYQPSWLQRRVTVDSDLNRRWQAMDSQQRDVADRMFRKAQDMHREMYNLAEADIQRAYDSMIERAQTEQTKEKHRKAKAKTLADLARKAQSTREAYLPLRRWGDTVLVYRSQAFRRAQKQGDDAAIRRMKQNADHYMVFFADGPISGRKLKADLERQYRQEGREITFDEPFQRMETSQESELVPYDMLQRLQEEAAVSESATVNNRVKDAINKLYIHSLADNTARKAELERMNVEGGGTDMVRAFADHGSSMAAINSALRINAQTRKLIAGLKTEAADPDSQGSRADRMSLLNEVLSRHAQMVDYTETPLQQKIMGYTSIWMLLTSPAYYLQNSTQPAMLTFPHLAARFGPSLAGAEMVRAYKHIRKLHRQRSNGALVDFSELSRQGSDTYDPGMHDLFAHLQRLGVLDVGMALDLGSIKQDRSKIGHVVGGAHEKMITAVRTVELYNRGVTAMATYRLALRQARNGQALRPDGTQGTLSGDAALQYARDSAVEAIMGTQGDYSGLNAPRLISLIPAGKVLTQFRKFQLIQISLLTRTLHSAFKGASPAERAVGRRQMGYILGMHGLVGGALGLPGANLIAWAMAHAFGDEDEPANAELLARRAIGDKDMADLVLRGLPAWAGVDTSNRLGMGLTFSVLPFNDFEASRSGTLEYMGALLTGPFGGAVAKGASGVGMIKDGELALGVANMTPSLIQNAIKAAVYHTEGIQTRGGDQAMSPEDLDMWDLMTQGFGWPSKKITDRYFGTNALRDVEQHFRSRGSAIRKAYIEGWDSGDSTAMREAIDEWIRLQQMKRKYRVGKPQNVSVLTRAPQEQAKRERLTVEGVPTHATTQDFVLDLFE